MDFRYIGKSGLRVSSICMGTMTFGSSTSKKEAFKILDKSYENGINFYDTAEIYPVPPKKSYEGTTTIKGKTYEILEIRFEQEGGGRDHDDVFHYWINQENNVIDYLAYNYITDGGGVRFRSAINKRRVDGLLVQDYINYAPVDKKMPLSDLITQFEKEALIERSRIINSEITLLSNN